MLLVAWRPAVASMAATQAPELVGFAEHSPFC